VPIRLVLAEDHYLVREGILRLLEARPDLDVPHSIFLKLGLTWEAAVHKRVKAVILYLAEGP
jgi:DNA-binding NarL/FixJ family response regulator